MYTKVGFTAENSAPAEVMHGNVNALMFNIIMARAGASGYG